jgi:hypothetical protein
MNVLDQIVSVAPLVAGLVVLAWLWWHRKPGA